MGGKRLELPIRVKLPNRVHRADGFTPDKENRELRRAGKSEEKRDEDACIS